jgi:hypothetical protein
MDTNQKDKQLEQDIIRAIQARGLREQMQAWDEENRRKQTSSTIRPLWPRLRKVVYSVAIAAMFVGVIIAVIPASTWQKGYRMVLQEYAHWFNPKPVYQHSSAEILAQAAPSIEEIGARNQYSHALGHEDPILEAVIEMNAGHYKGAQRILNDVQESIVESDSSYKEISDDLNYLDALCELGQGHRKKAYRQLQSIAVSDSRHASQAAELVALFQ